MNLNEIESYYRRNSFYTIASNPTTPPWVVYENKSLDGLSDEEFQYRYDIACQSRNSGDTLSMVQMHNMTTELASWPRDNRANRRARAHPQEAQTQRDRMDYADWLKLLHGVTYKTGWHAQLISPNHSHPWVTINLRVSVWADGIRKIEKTLPLCEEMLDRMKPIDALHLIDKLITECELAIKDVWLKHNEQPL